MTKITSFISFWGLESSIPLWKATFSFNRVGCSIWSPANFLASIIAHFDKLSHGIPAGSEEFCENDSDVGWARLQFRELEHDFWRPNSRTISVRNKKKSIFIFDSQNVSDRGICRNILMFANSTPWIRSYCMVPICTEEDAEEFSERPIAWGELLSKLSSANHDPKCCHQGRWSPANTRS
jgi:hypothetical protein